MMVTVLTLTRTGEVIMMTVLILTRRMTVMSVLLISWQKYCGCSYSPCSKCRTAPKTQYSNVK